jgi:hypothetical protein
MVAMNQSNVYAQRHWTNDELMADGFLHYYPVKRVTMVRMLPPEEAPQTMKASGNTITAEAGYWIAYTAGEALKEKLDDYDPRPIEPTIFAETYRPWDEPNEALTSTESHLQRLGCQPYYKIAGVWAKQLTADTWVQGIESAEPVLSPKNNWLCIGVEGEPWSMTGDWFLKHYLSPRHKSSQVHKDKLTRE